MYNPQGLIPVEKPRAVCKRFLDKEYAYRVTSLDKPYTQRFSNYPTSVLTFSNGNNHNIHPTQKPLSMFEYFIKTYSNPGDLILDTCIGSGTTALAAKNTGRRFVGFETDEKHFALANERIKTS